MLFPIYLHNIHNEKEPQGDVAWYKEHYSLIYISDIDVA